MTPSRSRRPRRSATAGEESPTRRPSSARLRRASAWSSASRRTFASSSRAPSADEPLCLWFEAMPLMLPAISHRRGGCGTAISWSMTTETLPAPARPGAALDRVPPHAYFVGSAVFHYLGPAFAVLLFARVDVLGVAWLRVEARGAVLGLAPRTWRRARAVARPGRGLLLAWGAVLAV